jgi:hypothetical protein
VVGLFVGCAVSPAAARAYATIEGPPIYSSASGLPDGRVYEQVSPTDKNGNQAGAGTDPFIVGANNHYGYATPDGNAVEFEGTGPMGESPGGASLFFAATKNKLGAGWSTRSLAPTGYEGRGDNGATTLSSQFVDVEPSSDLSHATLQARADNLIPPPGNECGGLYLVGPDPLVAATSLLEPRRNVSFECRGQEAAAVGGTRSFSTVYFTASYPLLPEDASRSPEAWGFYEDDEGTLREAGVLPDGSLSTNGAVPAASGRERARFGNEVSEGGERAFFVSPDPASCEQNGGHNDCSAEPPELYVRDATTRSSQLVSRDTLLPDESGLPARAPDGASPMLNPTFSYFGRDRQSYVFASPDGSQAFFQSQDQLAPDAPEGPPGNVSLKTYDFDLQTGTLTYLPGVTGQIIAADKGGSSLAFVRPEEGGKPAELGLWSAGPEGGSVTPVAEIPGEPNSGAGAENLGIPPRYISEARLSESGSVLAFTTATSLSSSFNSDGQEEIYRYDASANTLGCVSCAPPGVISSGPATMSSIEPEESYEFNAGKFNGVIETRGIAASGDRIFFDTPAPLVPGDTNTNAPAVEVAEQTFAKQGRDVYEWENGTVYLISGGRSPRDSYYLDSSENGDDVFFATTESLVPTDTDGGYDVYDARVPQAEDATLPPVTACEDSSCQGPVSRSSSPALPASATFSGFGNAMPEVAPPAPATRAKVPAKGVKCKRGYVKTKGKCIKNKAKQKAKKSSSATTKSGR